MALMDDRLHPDGKNLQGVFEHHDPDKVEVYCISLKRDGGSDVERKLQRNCQHFLDYTGAVLATRAPCTSPAVAPSRGWPWGAEG